MARQGGVSILVGWAVGEARATLKRNFLEEGQRARTCRAGCRALAVTLKAAWVARRALTLTRLRADIRPVTGTRPTACTSIKKRREARLAATKALAAAWAAAGRTLFRTRLATAGRVVAPSAERRAIIDAGAREPGPVAPKRRLERTGSALRRAGPVARRARRVARRADVRRCGAASNAGGALLDDATFAAAVESNEVAVITSLRARAKPIAA